MDNEVRHVVEFGEKTLSALAALTQAIKENNQLEKDGNPSEFAQIFMQICLLKPYFLKGLIDHFNYAAVAQWQ